MLLLRRDVRNIFIVSWIWGMNSYQSRRGHVGSTAASAAIAWYFTNLTAGLAALIYWLCISTSWMSIFSFFMIFVIVREHSLSITCKLGDKFFHANNHRYLEIPQPCVCLFDLSLVALKWNCTCNCPRLIMRPLNYCLLSLVNYCEVSVKS